MPPARNAVSQKTTLGDRGTGAATDADLEVSERALQRRVRELGLAHGKSAGA